VWQKKFEQLGDEGFTIVGLALDAEGVPPAKKYYDRFGVTFPALVDPDYATQFGAVPKTFFVGEDGKVLALENWEQRLATVDSAQLIGSETEAKWSKPNQRLDAAEIRRLSLASAAVPADLATATDLGSRYLALGLKNEARKVLQRAVDLHDAKSVARANDAVATLLGQAYFQLARCSDDRETLVSHARLSFYLNPSVGFGKQIARLIAPEKFDDRPHGDFDNPFREATLKQLQRERAEWLR
jgi:hypothetical protein